MPVPPMNLYARLRVGPVRQEDVDALLHAMEHPRPKGESAQARAEMLQRLVDDPTVGALRGRDGRRVDEAAAQALRAMDKADDEALSEQALEPLEQAARVPEPVPPAQSALEPRSPSAMPTWLFVSGVLSLFWGLCEAFTALSYLSQSASDGGLGLILISLLNTSLTMLLPGLLLVQAGNSSSRLAFILVISLIMILIPAGAILSLMGVMDGGDGRVASTRAPATLFFLGCGARFFLLIPLSAALGVSSRQKQGTSG